MARSKDREGVFDEIHNERNEQDAQWGGESHDDGHTPFDWLNFIEHQIVRAREGSVEYAIVRHRLVKIAALAVAGIESIDRCVDA